MLSIHKNKKQGFKKMSKISADHTPDDGLLKDQDEYPVEAPQARDEDNSVSNLYGLAAKTAFLTAEREKELWTRRHDPAAKAEILTAYFPLCQSLAIANARMGSGGKLRVDDYEAEARLAMVIAYDKYDPSDESGARFSSYAKPRIKHALMELDIRMSGPVKLATTKEQRSLFANWGRFNQQALIENRQSGTHARHVRIAELLTAHAPHYKFDADMVREYEARRASRGISMNAPLKLSERHADSAELIDFIAADYGNAESDVEERDDKNQKTLMKAALLSLDDRARDIISKRLLCEDDEKVSLHDLAATYGVSAERIRQIEVAALKKMRQFMEGDLGETPAAARHKPKARAASLHIN